MRKAPPAWRRWIATLCVALVAYVAFGHSDVANSAVSGDVSYNIACANSGQQDDGDQGAPAAPHHCCCAHAVGVPPVTAQLQTAPREELLGAWSDGFQPPSQPTDLDRPPKYSARV